MGEGLLPSGARSVFPRQAAISVLHIESGWKFREMIAFRNATARRLGLDLLVPATEEGTAQVISPVSA
jgi:sulfate adenylyltransferase subunit 2